MRYRMRAFIGALFLFIATPQKAAVLSQEVGAECAPVQRVINYLEARHLDYVIISGEAVKAWLSYLDNAHNTDIVADRIIIAANPETEMGMAMFVTSGAICLFLDFELGAPPVKLHRS